MSFVSALPFVDTLSYWWEALEGEAARPAFMATKLLEVSAFLMGRGRRPSAPQARTPTHVGAPKRIPSPLPAACKVVVVAPVFCATDRDHWQVERLAASLKDQSRPCEVIVVDDGSRRAVTVESAEVIRLPRNRGPAAARNQGCSRALELGADVVAFTDADCVPDPRWVDALVGAFRSAPDAHAIAGTTWAADRAKLGRYHERNGTLNGRRRSGDGTLLYGPTCNLAVRAELAEAIGFDESFPTAAAEDIEFCFRAVKDGYRIRHASDAVVHHEFGYDGLAPPAQLQRFWRQFRRYAAGERRLLAKHPDYSRAFAETTEIACGPTSAR